MAAIMASIAGFEIVAMAGFFLGAHATGLTIVLDGYIATAAALVDPFGVVFDSQTGQPVDGARVLYGDGWGLVRASNTQPILVLRFEATSADATLLVPASDSPSFPSAKYGIRIRQTAASITPRKTSAITAYCLPDRP